MHCQKFLFVIVLLIFTICGTACNTGPQKPEDFPDLTSCKLKVTQDGSPTEGIFISALRTDRSREWSIFGVTDANGIATMMTQDKFAGVPEGDYILTMTKQESEPSDTSVTGETTFILLEKKYTNAATSPLRLTVGSEPVKETYEIGKPVRLKY
ncbi:MAG: hypothetical protein Q4G68_13835 [Planctomycetia bacterium]|nr:hypothetical protein [Planctomycetia bacterium]